MTSIICEPADTFYEDDDWDGPLERLFDLVAMPTLIVAFISIMVLIATGAIWTTLLIMGQIRSLL